MQTVTRLVEHPRRAGRVVVYLDGEKLGALSPERVAHFALRVGAVLSPDAADSLRRSTRETACYDRAVDMLARRARSRADLGRRLREKEFAQPDIDSALDRLEALGLLDDLAFARAFARSRLSAARGFGPRRVAVELSRRGVARSIVDRVMAEFRDAAEDESEVDSGHDTGVASIDAVAERRMRSLSKLEPAVAKRRLYAFLARRGFEPDAIQRTVRRLIGPIVR